MIQSTQKRSVLVALLASFILVTLFPQSALAAETVSTQVRLVSYDGGKTAQLVLPPTVLFETNKAQLTTSGISVLDSLVPLLTEYTQMGGEVLVRGRASTDGDDSWNRRLSRMRSDAVVSHLSSKGIPVAQMEAVGTGEENSNFDDPNSRIVEFWLSSLVLNSPPPDCGSPEDDGKRPCVDRKRSKTTAEVREILRECPSVRSACSCDAEIGVARLDGFKDGLENRSMKTVFSEGDCRCSASSSKAYGEGYAEGFNARPQPKVEVVPAQWPKWVKRGTGIILGATAGYVISRHTNVYAQDTNNGAAAGYTGPNLVNVGSAVLGAGIGFAIAW